MARISMRNVQKSTVEEYFSLYLSSAAAKGVKDKTLETYKNHFRSISKRMNTTIPMNRLTSQDLEEMILKMREEGLSASSINSYTRTLKVFFSWCNEEGHTSLNIKLYKAPETVKEVYTDEELMILLKKPEANCNFCEYRNWVIINFLLNSGCRAGPGEKFCVSVFRQNQEYHIINVHDGAYSPWLHPSRKVGAVCAPRAA